MAKLKDNVSPEIKIQQPLKVEIIAPEKPTKTPSWLSKTALILSLILFVLSLVGLTLLITNKTVEKEISTPISGSILVDWPSFVSLRDPFDVTVDFHNQSQETLNGSLQLKIEPKNVTTLGVDGTNNVIIENLAPGASIKHTYSFVSLASPPSGFLYLEIQLSNLENQNVRVNLPEGKIRVIKIPRLRAALTWILSGSGLLTTFVGLFWNLIKKSL